MKCPFCRHPNTQVIGSRLLEETNNIRRRRRRPECGQYLSTFETVEMRMPQVTKTNGARVAFNPHKLYISLSCVLHKRPVSPKTIDGTVALIEQRLYQLGRKEVSSKLVGEVAMEELVKVDQVVYVRFVSVYRSFNDVSEFTQAIATLSKDCPVEQVAACQEGIWLVKSASFIFAVALFALTACGKTDTPHTPPATASSAAVAEDAPVPAENTVQTLISKDNKTKTVVANSHFNDVSLDVGPLPEDVSAEEMTLLQYDKMLGIILYADNLGPAQTGVRAYFVNLKNELQPTEGPTDAQAGIATGNRMNYRFSQTTVGGILNENCTAIHETNLYNVCANNNIASQGELASVLKEVNLIKQTDQRPSKERSAKTMSE